MDLARRMRRLESTELLMLMELADKKDIISFAGGFPSEDTFPVEAMKVATENLYKNHGRKALQYASTSGFDPLKSMIAERSNKNQHINISKDDIIITSGSQQTLDMLGMLMIDQGDVVMVESPSYIGALNAFAAYEPDFIEIPTDDEGINVESLGKILERRAPDVKMIYVIPDFQNPTGRVWSLERRKAFMELMNHFDIPIIEDMAYYELAYEDLDRPSLASLDKKDQVVSLGTFSKIFCPGLRIGWVSGNKEVLNAIRKIKPNVDLSSSNFAQYQIYEYMKAYDLDDHIDYVSGIYKKRRDLMLACIEAEFPDSITYTKPKGGLFTWIEMPEGSDAKTLFEIAISKGVAFVPGNSFFPKSKVPESMRVNFSCMQEAQIEVGAKRLGKAMKEYLGCM